MDSRDINSLVAFSRVCWKLGVSHDMQCAIYEYYLWQPALIVTLNYVTRYECKIKSWTVSNIDHISTEIVHEALTYLRSLDSIQNWWYNHREGLCKMIEIKDKNQLIYTFSTIDLWNHIKNNTFNSKTHPFNKFDRYFAFTLVSTIKN